MTLGNTSYQDDLLIMEKCSANKMGYFFY